LGQEFSYNSACDESLAEMAKNGNQYAFNELFLRYSSLIHIKASTFKQKFLEMDDMIQEGAVGLLYAVRAYDRCRGTSFKTFASVCIGRRLITAYNCAVNQKNIPLKNYISLGATTEHVGDMLGHKHSANDPEELFISAESVRQIEERITLLLSDKEKRVLLMYLSGMSYNEIANTLSLTSKKVDNALQRVRNKLRNS